MTELIIAAQLLTDIYGNGIKNTRLIFKDETPDELLIPDPAKGTFPSLNQTTYQQDFGEFTEKYGTVLQEVRVIFKDGAGASQFFPRGTDEKVVWDSVIPKEQLE